MSTVTGIGGSGRETQICRHFGTRFGSSHFKNVNSHRDRGGLVAKRKSVVTFGLALGRRVSKMSKLGQPIMAPSEQATHESPDWRPSQAALNAHPFDIEVVLRNQHALSGD